MVECLPDSLEHLNIQLPWGVLGFQQVRVDKGRGEFDPEIFSESSECGGGAHERTEANLD
jgi:hypothetical protein